MRMSLVRALPALIAVVALAGCAGGPANEDAAYAACERDVTVQFEVPESAQWPADGWSATPEGDGYFVTASVPAEDDAGQPVVMNVECHLVEDNGAWSLTAFNLYLAPQ